MVVQALRHRVADTVIGMVAEADRGPRVPRAADDPGMIARDSVAWAVHGDFTTMMIGGTAALLMQMLHPAALAGVWDHSSFSGDASGRLRRTAQFIAGTTYGSAEEAEALVALVRRIHDRIHGQLPDGTHYDANDPALLTFVHVAGALAFVDAYHRYKAPLSRAEQDRYFVETAAVARGLGAVDMPETRAAADAVLDGVRETLRSDRRTRATVRSILGQTPPHPALAPVMRTIMHSGIDLLPDWAAAQHGLHLAPHQRLAARTGARGIGSMLRWALAAKAA